MCVVLGCALPTEPLFVTSQAQSNAFHTHHSSKPCQSFTMRTSIKSCQQTLVPRVPSWVTMTKRGAVRHHPPSSNHTLACVPSDGLRSIGGVLRHFVCSCRPLSLNLMQVLEGGTGSGSQACSCRKLGRLRCPVSFVAAGTLCLPASPPRGCALS